VTPTRAAAKTERRPRESKSWRQFIRALLPRTAE
jgi:hypothetical protein